jgi:hypothetical protein
MTTRIGIGVAADSVSAVVARGAEVEWSGIDITDGDGLDAALARLLIKLPRDPWPRAQVHVGVSGDYAHIKTIHALPPVRDARALGRIVAASPSRFFVLSPGTATVTGVRVLDEGVVRAAVIDSDVIAVIQDACGAKGLKVARVVPAEIALSSLPEEERLDPCALGLGAIFVNRREPIVVRPRRWEGKGRTIGAVRIALAAGVATIAIAAAMTLPTLATKRRAATAQHEIASLAPTRARTLAAERSLTEAARMLTAVSEFERRRTSITWVLHQLVNALPAKAAIVSLKVDTAAVTLSVLASRAADVVRGIQDMPGASKVEVIGAITYETAAANIVAGVNPSTSATALERVTIRFRLAPDPNDLRIPLVAESGEKK